MTITIVGLGPGDAKLLTRQAWEVLTQAGTVYLRTARHPVVAGLPAGLQVVAFDGFYEGADGFAEVYDAIVDQVLALGRRPRGVIYAVPGHPLIGEATVTAILARAEAEGMPVRVVAGLSFIEATLTALRIDAMAGLQVGDALDIAQQHHPVLNPDSPALLGQLYSRELAGDVKLTLMNQYPDEHPVRLVHAAGTPEETVEDIHLYALDHSRLISHLTTLFIPPLPQTSGFERLQETIARLRGPGGCPWDQAQTHQSLCPSLIEEAAEVLEAIDTADSVALCEELGDLLLVLLMQSQIAVDEGEFTAADVIAGIEAKIRRRHPHVFGGEKVDSAEQVLVTWERIKQQERRQEGASAPSDLPATLSALTQADATARKAAATGFDWAALDDVVAKVREEMDELLAACTDDDRMAELGDLLFTMVNWARWLGLDPETALRMAVRRFRERFAALERFAAQAGGVANLTRSEVTRLWKQTRPVD